MNRIQVKTGSGRSNIMVGERLANLGSHLPKGRTIIITDDMVRSL